MTNETNEIEQNPQEVILLNNQEMAVIDFKKAMTLDPKVIATRDKIVEFRERAKNLQDPNTIEGYDEHKELLDEAVSTRTGLEKHRKKITAPFLSAQKIIKAQCDEYDASLRKLEAPIRDKKTAVDDRRKELEAEKARKLAAKLAMFTQAHIDAERMSSDQISDLIVDLEGADTELGFGADKAAAIRAQSAAVKRLKEMLGNCMAQEQLAIEQAERAAEKRQAEETKRIDGVINDIQKIAVQAIGLTDAKDVENLIDVLESMPVTKAALGDRSDEAKQVANDVMDKLNLVLNGIIAADKAAEKLAAEQEEEDKRVSVAALAATEEAVQAVEDEAKEEIKEEQKEVRPKGDIQDPNYFLPEDMGTGNYTGEKPSTETAAKCLSLIENDGKAAMYDQMMSLGLQRLPIYTDAIQALEMRGFDVIEYDGQ